MASAPVIVRLLVVCALSWVLIINACIPHTGEIGSEEWLAFYGIVTDISESGGGAILTLSSGADVRKILFNDSDRLPDIGRAVIVLARADPGGMLLGISYDYP